MVGRDAHHYSGVGFNSAIALELYLLKDERPGVLEVCGREMHS
jgi:hypothetical protein